MIWYSRAAAVFNLLLYTAQALLPLRDLSLGALVRSTGSRHQQHAWCPETCWRARPASPARPPPRSNSPQHTARPPARWAPAPATPCWAPLPGGTRPCPPRPRAPMAPAPHQRSHRAQRPRRRFHLVLSLAGGDWPTPGEAGKHCRLRRQAPHGTRPRATARLRRGCHRALHAERVRMGLRTGRRARRDARCADAGRGPPRSTSGRRSTCPAQERQRSTAQPCRAQHAVQAPQRGCRQGRVA